MQRSDEGRETEFRVGRSPSGEPVCHRPVSGGDGAAESTGPVLVARMDNAGDVLLAGPAVRAVAHTDDVVLLVGPRGRAAAELLPGVRQIIEWSAPWVGPDLPKASRAHVERLVRAVSEAAPRAALILTSFHQSPLPLAVVLRMAGVPWIGAISEDYPGTLLDLRHRVDQGGATGDIPEPERMLDRAARRAGG